MIVVRGGEVLTAEGWARADVSIEGGSVSAVGPDLCGSPVIDATGCLVGPGLVDMHTHLRDPGQTWKEDISSGSAAAAAGGFTAITAMPNTDPPMDTRKVVESVLATAAEVGLVDVVPSAALTVGRSGATTTDIADLHRAGVRLFTDDGDAVADPDVLEKAMIEVARLSGAVVAQHAEDPTKTQGAHMHEGDVSRSLGIEGMPPEAEAGIVARDLGLARQTGARYHCQHVSADATVELIRSAKESGMNVTAEVTPHHLVFDESYLTGLDPDFKMYPPLRSAIDRAALVSALGDGTIDVVATDHAPHLTEEKEVGFEMAPRGVIGLETAAAATWETLQDRDGLFMTLSINPARILGLTRHGQPLQPGTPANVVVFDPSSSWLPNNFRSKSTNSPFRGREMRGRVAATIRDGRVVYSNGDLAR